MKFKIWIEKLTPTKVANLLEVDVQAVYYWRDLERLPKPETMLAIKRASRGAVGYADMIEPFFKRRENSL